MTPDEGELREEGRSSESGLRDQEPFRTIRAHPRRFGWGIPLVFGVSLLAGGLLVGVNFSLAIAVQLLLQTAGLLWLYIPVARAERRGEGAAAGGGSEEGPSAGT